jgi:hypothetical protein
MIVHEQHQQIIHAATLGFKLWHINDEGEELEEANRAFQAALSQLPEDRGTVMMVIKLLDGKPYSMTSNNPDNIQRCIAIAEMIGATVEDSEVSVAHLKSIGPGLRTITVYPPLQATQ